MHIGQIATMANARLNRHKDALAIAIERRRIKSVMEQCFLHWKVRKLKHDNKVSRELLAAGMDMLSLPSGKHFHDDGNDDDDDDDGDEGAGQGNTR